jgi:peptidoglycan/xylan/chitin deacetylase (PgdA/CDA1 family)
VTEVPLHTTRRGESRAKRWAKLAFYWVCLTAGPIGFRNAWLRLRRRTRYTVLVYHRVNDISRDNLTTSIARFSEHMLTISKRYPVVRLQAAIDRGDSDEYPGPNVVIITFDDGYADNYEQAAPILERFGLPASFFVTAGFVGTASAFEHDARAAHRFENLTWDQVRSLAARGFEIGSHGMSHANLVRCPLDRARHEIRDSRAILQDKLGRSVRSFAYPFGGRSDVTPALLGEIRAAGYDVIASAYGGVNYDGCDPSNVLRAGMSQSFDPLSLRAQIEGVSLQNISRLLVECVGPLKRRGAGRATERMGADGTKEMVP